MKNSLNDLRNHLFETIERLKLANDPDADEKERISIEHAQAIADIGDVIVRSVKLEVDALKIISNSQNPDLSRTFMEKSGAFLLEPKKNID